MARRGHYKGRMFRSLMEYSFYKHIERTGVKLEDIGYESLRIPYTLGKKSRTYIPDFVVGDMVVEVKPEARQRGKIFDAKVAAARKYCSENGLRYSVVGARDFKVIPARLATRDPDVVMRTKRRRRKR